MQEATFCLLSLQPVPARSIPAASRPAAELRDTHAGGDARRRSRLNPAARSDGDETVREEREGVGCRGRAAVVPPLHNFQKICVMAAHACQL